MRSAWVNRTSGPSIANPPGSKGFSIVCLIKSNGCIIVLLPELFAPAKTVTSRKIIRTALFADLKPAISTAVRLRSVSLVGEVAIPYTTPSARSPAISTSENPAGRQHLPRMLPQLRRRRRDRQGFSAQLVTGANNLDVPTQRRHMHRLQLPAFPQLSMLRDLRHGIDRPRRHALRDQLRLPRRGGIPQPDAPPLSPATASGSSSGHRVRRTGDRFSAPATPAHRTSRRTASAHC